MIRLKGVKKILLVEPPFFKIIGYQRWYYPVTLTIVGSYLEESGYEVNILDADRPDQNCRSLARDEVRNSYHIYDTALRQQKHYVWDEVLNAVERIKPDAVGLTAISAQIGSADLIAKKIKENFGKGVKTMLGGAHVDGISHMFADYDFGPQYDLIIKRDLSLFNKVFDRKPKRELIMDLDKYNPRHLCSVLTSVGCPNRCSFCHHSFDKFWACRKIDNLSREFNEIRNNFPGESVINIIDESLFSRNDYCLKVMALLRQMGLKFTAGVRIADLSCQRIEEFIGYGGIKMHVGIESGSQRTLDKIGKKTKIQDVVRCANWLNEAGLPWQAFFIVGFPFETMDDLKLVEELIYKIRPTFVSLNRFTPYPGTQIYKEYYSKKQVDFSGLFQLNGHSCVKLDDDIELYIDRLFDLFDCYNNTNVKKDIVFNSCTFPSESETIKAG